MHVQFTFCVYEEEILENCKTICLTKLPLLKNLKTYANQKERYSNHHRKEKTREISIFKEDWQNLGVFIANYPFKK